MELIRGLHSFRPRHRGCVATIGAFDGVHLGHQAVLRQLQRKGEELGLPVTVVVFEPLPREYFSPHDAPPRLMSFREKFNAFAELGIDRLLRIRFTPQLRDMGAREFAQRVYVDGLGAKCIIVGDDMRFGRNRSGDVNLLRQIGDEQGFTVVNTETVELGGERVSSTRLREVLGRADFAMAEQLLGRPYSIAGRVVVGNQLGRKLGTPTANLELHRLQSPLHGVFAVEVLGVGDKPVPAVANVGTRPTVDDLPRAILEAHLLNWSGNLYHRKLRVVFRKKLREEIKFDGLDALTRQIALDVEQTKVFFGLD